VRATVLFDRHAHHALFRHRADHPFGSRTSELEDLGDAWFVGDALSARGFETRLVALEQVTASRQLSELEASRPDIVFNLCDTLGGEGAPALLVTAALESFGIPFTGSGTAGLALSKRKHDVKAALVRAGLPTPRYQVVEGAADAARFELALELPVIVKPAGEHASIGIDSESVCFEEVEVRKRCRSIIERFGGVALVEEYVGGKEAYVSLLGSPPQALHLMELGLEGIPEGYLSVRTFDQKWFGDSAAGGDVAIPRERRQRPIPVRSPAAPFHGTIHDVSRLCAEAFVVGGGRDWGRVDLRVDAGKVPLIIDVTPNTYLTPTSPCGLAAAAAGVEYGALIGEIVSSALCRSSGARVP